MINKKVILDGVSNGVLVKLINPKTNRFDYATRKNGEPRLFKNFKIAKLNADFYFKNYKHRYIFKIGDKYISFNDCISINNSYQYIDNNDGIRYIITEEKEYKIIYDGYIVFEDGDTKRTDKKNGFKKQKELMLYITDICGRILRNSSDSLWEKNIFISSIKKKENFKYSEIIVSLGNSTAKIHIMNNSRLMDINQERKEQNLRAIPFLKNMDKFTTMSIFVTKDYLDPINNNSEEKADTIINELIDTLNDNMPELKTKLVNVEFTGYVNIMED